MTPEDVERAWTLEEQLLTPEVRSDAQALGVLLAPDFHEIGQSGRHWHCDDLVAVVTADPPADPTGRAQLQEKRADVVVPGLVLLTYRLEFEGYSSRRSSLWRSTDTGMQMVYHQGTPLSEEP